MLSITIWLPSPALAREITFDDTVEEGEVLEQNLILAGPVVSMDGVIKGDLVVVGDEVRIGGQVDGSLIVVGKDVILNGPVAGSAVVSALNLVLGPQASIGRDVHFVGGGLETQESSTVNRDLNVLSLETDLSGNVNRQLNALVGPLNLAQGVYRYLQNQGWLPQTQQPGSWLIRDGFENQAVLGMAFGLPSLHNLGLVSSSPTGEPAVKAGPGFQAPAQESVIDVERLKSWAIPFLRNLASLLILGLLAVWLVPAQLSWAGEQARTKPWRTLLTGLIVLIVGWVAVFLAFVLILVLAIFFYWVSLPTLGFLAGMLGLTALGLAASIFWLSIAYFSKLIIAFLVGTLLFKRMKPDYAHSRIWPLLAGVALYALLASIPYLGWLLAVLATLSGLGALWMVTSPSGLPEGKSAPQLQPAGD